MMLLIALILPAVWCSPSVMINHPSQIHGFNVDNGCGNPISDVFRLVSNVVQPIIGHSVSGQTSRQAQQPMLQTSHFHSPTVHRLPIQTPTVQPPYVHVHHRYFRPLPHRIPHFHHHYRHVPRRRLNLLHRLKPKLRMNRLCNGVSCSDSEVDYSDAAYPKLSLSKKSSLLTNNGHSRKLIDTYYNKIY